jgi:hypothetical protein
MIAPKWLNTAVSPLRFLMFLNYYQDHCSIHLPIIKALILAVLTYLPREMLLGYRSKKLKRWIWLFQWWLLNYHLIGCITSTSYKLACALVSSMRVEVVCKETRINNLLDVQPMSYQQAFITCFNQSEWGVASSWKDSLISGRFTGSISEYLTVPKKNCFIDRRKAIIDREYTINKIWSLGGDTGWLWWFGELGDLSTKCLGCRLQKRTNKQTWNS